jgi:hypothetical protein
MCRQTLVRTGNPQPRTRVRSRQSGRIDPEHRKKVPRLAEAEVHRQGRPSPIVQALAAPDAGAYRHCFSLAPSVEWQDNPESERLLTMSTVTPTQPLVSPPLRPRRITVDEYERIIASGSLKLESSGQAPDTATSAHRQYSPGFDQRPGLGIAPATRTSLLATW